MGYGRGGVGQGSVGPHLSSRCIQPFLLVTDAPQEVVTEADREHAITRSSRRGHAAEIDLAFRVDLGSPGDKPLAAKDQILRF